MTGKDLAGLHLVDRRLVIRMHVVHRTNHRELVDNAGHVRQQFRNIHAGLSALVEGPPAAKQLRRPHLKRSFQNPFRYILSVMAIQIRLGIEQINLAWAALHAQMNDSLGLGREMRLLRCQVQGGHLRLRMRIGSKEVVAQKTRQCRAMQTVLHAIEEASARYGLSAWGTHELNKSNTIAGNCTSNPQSM